MLMNNVKSILKYQLLGFRKPVFILAAVMLVIGLLVKFAVISFDGSAEGYNFSGFEITFAIFLFVGFIASFKTDFNHMNVNGVTRKAFFTGHLAATVMASILMIALYWVLWGVYVLLGAEVSTFVSGLYNSTSFAVDMVFAASLFILAAMGGWLIGLLGYRFGTPMIIALAVSPAVLSIAVPILIRQFNLAKQFVDAARFYFGLGKEPLPLQASLNFLLTAVVIAFINWLLIRKITVKM